MIPYVMDQLAMARLSRATFSLMLALLPVFATLIGAVVLRQIPTVQDAAGIGLVVAGVAVHQVAADRGPGLAAGKPPTADRAPAAGKPPTADRARPVACRGDRSRDAQAVVRVGGRRLRPLPARARRRRRWTG